MKITTFLRDLFGSKDVIYLNERLDTMCTNIAIDSFATQVAI
ncbi:phage portal protein, partial [Clostridium botulinum]|nr:phage portal protein [Clostridium botulinum]MBY7009606.1 phage portal protein [Clostridium botulinum]NFH74583.1 phage portal protein [Clostridium botulinum]NFI02803.1 phage portal protein [Clostridium botulinum]NFI65230.1 phage portal protein [Clostridium botulinum]